jgi:hypothetical protein
LKLFLRNIGFSKAKIYMLLNQRKEIGMEFLEIERTCPMCGNVSHVALTEKGTTKQLAYKGVTGLQNAK